MCLTNDRSLIELNVYTKLRMFDKHLNFLNVNLHLHSFCMKYNCAQIPS